MGKTYRTAKGQLVDIEAIAMANEKTVAVGNMGVNAKGDKVKGGKVIVPAAERVAPYHRAKKQVTTGSIRPPITTERAVAEDTIQGEVKEREDGTRYEEIVNEDGSIETRELGESPEKKAATRKKKGSL
jgi:hypothetical protein